jgi:hypothetical protein
MCPISPIRRPAWCLVAALNSFISQRCPIEDEDDDEYENDYEMLRRRPSLLLDSSSWLLPSQRRQGHPLNDTGLDPANVQFQGAIRSLEEWVGTIRQGDLQVAWAFGLVLQL